VKPLFDFIAIKPTAMIKIFVVKIFLALFLTTVFFGSSKADLGAPFIQAVCKVTLITGEEIDGIITFGRGGYYGKYRPHGFCFAFSNGTHQLKLYGFTFKSLTPENLGAFRAGRARLFYVKNVTEQFYPETKKEWDEERHILSITTSDKSQYKLEDKMPLYKELPIHFHVGFDDAKDDGKTEIKVSDIYAVELLENPGEFWLNKIKSAREKLTKKIDDDVARDGNTWQDYQEPAWYHEIIRDDETLNYLVQFL